MARKHFDEFYNNIAKGYMEQNLILSKMVEEVEKGNVSEDRIELLKENMKPIVANFATVSYIKFLLDLPTKKHKHARFKKMNKKILSQLDPALSPEQLIRQNEESLARLRDLLE